MPKKAKPAKPPRPYFDRPVATRDINERFLIVCEGEETERRYFQSFRVPKDVITVYGLGFNTAALVEEALRLSAQGNYDQVWCVFDRDSFPVKNFNQAIELARQNSISVAYSNEAFELWYLLHFHYYNTGISRDAYKALLTNLLEHEYKKNSGTIYEELLDRQHTAASNAARLLKEYAPRNPAYDNPSTTVHLLVEQLNRFVR
jgi:hypothetical protein